VQPRNTRIRASPSRGNERRVARASHKSRLSGRLALYVGLIGAAILGAMGSRMGTAEAMEGFGKLSSCLESRSKADSPICLRKAVGSDGAWKLLRSRDPSGGPDAVSIIRTAELLRSDPDIAGLMLRCAGSDIETLIIVIEPRLPRARPRIGVAVKGASVIFEATVAPPFTALLLPKEATALLTGPWASAPELAITIEGDPSPERGVVLLAGLRQALDRLTIACVQH
jgi:hypothetical protein